MKITGLADPENSSQCFLFLTLSLLLSRRSTVPTWRVSSWGQRETVTIQNPRRLTFSARATVTTQGRPSNVSHGHSCMIANVIVGHFMHEENENPCVNTIDPESVIDDSGLQPHFPKPCCLPEVLTVSIPRYTRLYITCGEAKRTFRVKKINGISSLRGRI